MFQTFPTILYPKEFFDFHDVTEEIVKARIQSKTHYGDFVDKIIEVCNDANSNVSSDTIKAQGAIFFAAGFETTSNNLTTLCYNLAIHPNIQDKLFEEIESIDKIDSETINNLHYMEASIMENLRMYAPVIIQERICKKDTELKGMLIKRGTMISIPIIAAHMNPDFFPEPEVFKPERFLKENQDEITPYTFLAFSGGPRICLGQRFAMVEMKMLLANMLKKFKIETCPDTKLKFNQGDLFITNYDEIMLKLTPRRK